uniref:Probable protein-export membrane protein SecG n=1 Tax=Renouxia sp. TaxID=2485823 RepID=A0A3G3MHF2_9FLOR|nr:preprotein translocase subunit G [Renouxia sp.]
MKFFWYLSSILTILLVLISNPKAANFSNIAAQSQLFSYNRGTQRNMKIATGFASLIFLFLTVLLNSNFSI